jgi:hypothetical protein
MDVIARTGAALLVAVLMVTAVAGIAAGQEVRVCARDLLAAAGEDPGERPGRPVVIVAARNGAFSGKVAVSNAQTLGVRASDLKAGTAVIPAKNVAIRYGVPPAQDLSQRMPRRIDPLLEAPPKTLPAEIEVWATVHVPADAAAGNYRGTLRVAGTDVPLEVKVQDWTLPEPQNYRSWVDMIQSPDTLALEYNVPLWSEKHWSLIAKSLRLMGQSGN